MSKYETNSNLYEYPNGVLKNNLDIHDAQKLQTIEHKFVIINTKSLNFNQIKLPISNINYFCSIHKHLFKDLYTWAGKLRKIHISKGSTRFANFSYIITSWDDLVEPKVNNLTNSKNKIQLLAEIWGDINAIHPFREGNGRVCRLYIAKLASLHGLPIDFSNITHKEKLNASTQSIKGKLNLIIKLINKSLI